MEVTMIFATVFTAILVLALIKYLFHLAAEDTIDKEIKDLNEQAEFLEKARQKFEEKNKTEH